MGIIRNTKSLKVILDIFEQTDNAISVVDLSEGLAQKMNKTTVYRILKKLEDNGTLHSFTGKDGRLWYAKDHGCVGDNRNYTHPHFQC